jgi:hypothetical protein
MSSVKTQSRYDASRHLNFISTAPFNNNFHAYTFTGPSPGNNFTGFGELSAVLNSSGVAVTDINCPAGRVLRTNGKKLYPDAAALSLTTYPDRSPLVGVFDYFTNLSGFINPNDSVFALYNVDKPVDNVGGTEEGSTNNSRGMSVYTGGNVTAIGDITTSDGNIAATTGNITATAGNIVVTAGSLNVGTRIAGTVAFASAAVFTATVAAGTNTLVVTAIASGTIQNGATISGGGIAGAPTITAFVSGTPGGVGTYTISGSAQAAARTPTGGTVPVSGVVALNLPGVTTSSLAFVNPTTQANLSVNYKTLVAANLLTITALVAAGTVNSDTSSVVNYFVVN